MRVRAILTFWLICCLPVLADDSSILKDFQAHTDDYLKLRKQATRGIPALKAKAEPEQIEKHKQALSQAIRNARAQAKQGDIITPAVQAYLIEIVRSEMKGRAGIPAKQAAKQGNPTVETPSVPVPVKVNGVYPDKAPASTVAATLLARLPALPDELDFRFVGRHLVLRDVAAGLIVDYVPNATP